MKRYRLACLLVGLAVSVGIAATGTTTVSAQDDETAATESELAERYAPIIVIKEQAEECDTEGEPYAPANVDIILDNPEIALRQLSEGNPVVTRAPSASDLFELGEGFFLDFPGSSLSPGCIYEHDFERYSAGVPPTVYAHVVQQADEPDLVFVQYWFYWYFNDWNNKHESDWEGITLKFEAATIDEALAVGPSEVGYSQHEGGEWAAWGDDKLERDGDRPVVYSSAGSHASYFSSAVYLGRGASEGFGCDDTTGPSERLDVDVVVLPDDVTDSSDSLAWLSYDGRWGERQNGPFNGPTGPNVKDRWSDPAPWFEELRSSSVVIPAGDSAAGEVIDVFCVLVEKGSGALISWTVSPTRLIIGAIVLALVVRFLIGRTDWSVVALEPLVRRRRAGQILRAAFREYRRTPAMYMMFGLVYAPAALITGVLVGLVQFLPFVSSIFALASGSPGTNLVLAAFAGSVANLAAFVAVNAVVAEHLEHGGSGPEEAIRALRTTWSRRRALLSGFLRAFAIVFALLVTIIGAPWGIRQLVRYQFLAQAVIFDDGDGRQSLGRSSELVTGRWWHTALITAVIQTTVGATALVAGLLLLVLVSGIPIWIFSALVSLIYILVVPLAALAMTMLYGDASAQASGDEITPPAPVEVG